MQRKANAQQREPRVFTYVYMKGIYACIHVYQISIKIFFASERCSYKDVPAEKTECNRWPDVELNLSPSRELKCYILCLRAVFGASAD